MAQKLKFGNGTWATKEGSTLAYNDEKENYKPLPFNFERDSIATRVNKEGLIEVVGNDTPRIDYTDSADGVLLLEPSRTNLILNSQKISLSPTKSGNFVDNFAISPDGTQNATKLTSTSTDPFFYQNVTFSAADYTSSLYVKGIGDSIGKEFRFSIKGITHSSNKYIIPSEWKRFDFTATVTSGSGSIGLELPDPSVIGDEVLVWGWQLEQGSYATSYIPTSGSTVQRAAETANGSGNSEVFNDSEGVLFADIAANSKGGGYKLISLTDSTSGNSFISIGMMNNTTQSYKQIRFSGVNLFSYYTDPINQTDFNKIAIKYKSGNSSFYVNGFEIDSSSVTYTPNAAMSELKFSYFQDGDDFYGKTKEIGYYDTALTDEELEYMTSYRSLNELVTELNLNEL